MATFGNRPEPTMVCHSAPKKTEIGGSSNQVVVSIMTAHRLLTERRIGMQDLAFKTPPPAIDRPARRRCWL